MTISLQVCFDSKERTKVLEQCTLDSLQSWVTKIKAIGEVKIIKAAQAGLVMMRARDAVAEQIFNLGEVLVSECTVMLDKQTGYGLVMGNQPERAEAMAILDALFFSTEAKWARLLADMQIWLKKQAQVQEKEQQKEFQLIERSKVNFETIE